MNYDVRTRPLTHRVVSFLCQDRPLEIETALFILVNILDVVMTFVLLSTGSFQESNPIANYVLVRSGFSGMVIFKFAFVAGIAVIAQFVATRQPRTARNLLYFGSISTGAVVSYSLYMWLTHFGYL